MMPASDVRDARATLELLHDAVERGQPRGHQIRIVAGTKESLGAVKKTGMMLTPFHAFSAFKVFDGSSQGMEGRFHNIVGARHINGPVGIGHAQGLLGRHRCASSAEVTARFANSL
jgi:hypothetical protein